MHSPRTFMRLFFLGSALTLLTAPATAQAEAISVTPLEWDFGEVVVGESASKVFRIESLDSETPVIFDNITIENDPLSAFAITHIDPIPPELWDDDDPVDFEVTFAPLSLGLFAADIRVESDDTHNYPPDGTVFRPLTGVGIPEPATAALFLLGIVGVGCRRWRLARW